MKFKARYPIVEAHQLRPDNIKHVERWCGGSIKGTALLVEDQAIDIWSCGEEHRAEMFDYITKDDAGVIRVYSPTVFDLIYTAFDTTEHTKNE